MSADPPPKFASRRPDWQLPELQLDQLQLHPFDALQEASSRQPCPQCQRSRLLYCYDCAVAFTAIPSVQLPFKVSIITHHAELASKNTGVHAAILCPGQVHMHSVDQMPGCDPSRCVVMFPSEDALLPDQLDLQHLERVVIIDSKWAKAKELNQHKAFDGMKRVKLPGTPKSAFWRFHTSGVSDEGVCTIEALHLLLQAVAGRLPNQAQRAPHYFDNLLWYFAFQHQLVAKAAAERQRKKQLEQQPHQNEEQQQQQQQRRYPLQQGRKTRRQQPQQQNDQRPGKQQERQQECLEQQARHLPLLQQHWGPQHLNAKEQAQPEQGTQRQQQQQQQGLAAQGKQQQQGGLQVAGDNTETHHGQDCKRIKLDNHP